MANNYMLNDQFPKAIKNATSTSDGLMSSEDKAKFDSVFDDLGVLKPATIDKDGLMTKEDKKKLDELEKTNSYTHPDTHPASMIVEDSTHRFVSDENINEWNTKATTDTVTQTTNGLMSSTDKVKLDNIETGANKYVHPTGSSYRHVTDEQISTWNAKASTALATQTVNGLMSSIDKIKLDVNATNANNYTHPNTHPASMIVEDSTHRFVTDTDKNNLQNLLSRMDNIERQYAEMLAKLQTAVFIE